MLAQDLNLSRVNIVSFGGIAGLFLGFSLLSGVELVYYFTMRACCMVYREPKRLKKQQMENETEHKINRLKCNYDLSLVPYFVKPPSSTNGIKLIDKKQDKTKLKRIAVKEAKPTQPKKEIKGIKSPFGIEYLP